MTSAVSWCFLQQLPADKPSMEVMMPRHGLVSGRFGRRIRSFGSGGRRVGASLVEVPLGGMMSDYGIEGGAHAVSLVVRSTTKYSTLAR